MKFLPLDNITYKTRLTKDEIIQKLAKYLNIIKSEKIFKLTSSYKYEGKIDGQVFNIKKVVLDQEQYSEASNLIPEIKGIIQQDYEETIIKVKMRLSRRSIISLCSIFALLGFILILALVSRHLLSIHVFICNLFIYGFIMVSFKSESIKQKKEFQELFEADIISD